jgi:uncharacterized protein (TIGR00725 family)
VRRRYVAVVGPGDGASGTECAHAADVGRLLAENGVVVLTGGLGGVMAAAAGACESAGGIAVALLPGRTREGAPDVSSVVLPTGLGQMRNALLVGAADAVIAVGGSWGTLSEIALARRIGIPVVCLGAWAVTDADGSPVELTTVHTPAAAVQAALAGRMDE